MSPKSHRTTGPLLKSAASSPWRNRVVGQADVPPETLLAHPENWRRHPEHQRRALRSVLGEIGWVQRVVVNRRTGHILDGHARVDEALARHEPTVPVTYVDLDPDEERTFLATFDVIGSLAAPDTAAFEALLAGLAPMEIDLQAMLDELAESLPRVNRPRTDPDAVPVAPDASTRYVQAGQLWRLGTHRVLCGDALDPIDVDRLLAGERPSLLATDPPYGVNLDLSRRHARDGGSGGSRTARGTAHRRLGIAGDTRAEWSAAFALAPSVQVAYVWRPAVHAGPVAEGLERIGFELVSEIVWVKSRWAVGPRWYHWAHEACIVARRRGSRHRFLGGRDQGTVWEAPSPKVGGAGADPKVDHPSQKPVVLFERPIRNHLVVGGLVYDPFLGSGTTLIAAEVSRRRCLGMEIDPAFVQVAIERWQALTGETAVLLEEAA